MSAEKPYTYLEFVVGCIVISIVIAVGFFIYSLWPLVVLGLLAWLCVWATFFSRSARRRRERREIKELHDKLKQQEPQLLPALTDSYVRQVFRLIEDQIGALPVSRDERLFTAVIEMLATMTREPVGMVPPIPDTDDRVVLARYRDELVELEQKLQSPPPPINPAAPVADCFVALFEDLPRLEEDETPYQVALGDLLEHPGATVEHMVYPFLSNEVVQAGQFADLRAQLENNFRASKDLPSQRDGSARELAGVFFRNTPLERVFDARVPFHFPEEQRLEHMVVVAGSGHGKTQMLESLVCADLESNDPPGMVVIDSKGDMIERLSRLELFDPDIGRLRDRLIIVDAHDTPSLNPFDVRLDETGDDQAVSRVIGGMSYFFQALLGSELSGSMRVALIPFLHLMTRIPGATLDTLCEAMASPKRYADVIATLPQAPRSYLENEYGRVGQPTKNAVKDRIYDLRMTSPAFDRMFGAKRNAIDLAQALNEGKIVLVNLDRDFLEREPSAILGKWFIAQTYRAALRRAALPPHRRRAAYLIVDEAGPYFDAQTEDILRTMRSYRVGAVLAFQDFHQAPQSLQAAISSSTAIRLAGGPSDIDARLLAGMLRTQPEFILSRRKRDRHFSEFACFVARLTPHAVSLSVPHGTVDRLPHMSEEQYQELRVANRTALTDVPSLPPPESVSQTAEPAATPAPVVVRRAPEIAVAPRHEPQHPDDMDTGAAPWPS